MPKQVTVQLGGREYIVKEKPMGVNGTWRKKLRESSVMRVLESLDGFLDDLVSAVNSVPDGGSLSDIDLGKVLGVARVLPATVNALANSTDEIAALLFEYEPKLKTDKKWLEQNAYDDEIVTAFIEVLKLTFPIMALWGMVTGSRVQQTHGNSPSANGATNGLPVSGPKKKASTS